MNGKKKKFLHRLILVKKIPANSNVEKKKKKFTLRRDCPTHLPTHTKIKWSVPKSIQKKIVEYDIKSKYPEEYSTVDKVGGEKPLASKSC